MAARAENQAADATTAMEGDMAANMGNDGGHDAAAMEAAMSDGERRGGLAVFDSVDLSTPVEFVTQWSTSRNDQFTGPIGIAVGPSGLGGLKSLHPLQPRLQTSKLLSLLECQNS